MKINEIFEQRGSSVDLKTQILTHCQPYINEIGAQRVFSNFLFHGTFDGFEDTIINLSRSHEVKEDFIDSAVVRKMREAFSNIYNFDIKRSMYVSTDIHQAREYASDNDQIYAIFPINHFTYLWSPTVFDMYYAQATKNGRIKNTSEEVELNQVQRMVKCGDYRNTNLKNAFGKKVEVLINAQQAIVVPLTRLGELNTKYNKYKPKGNDQRPEWKKYYDKTSLSARLLPAKRFPDEEHMIAQNATDAYDYATRCIRGRFPLGEPAIAKDPKLAWRYAAFVLKDRFPLGEPAIEKDPVSAREYDWYIMRHITPTPITSKGNINGK